MTIMGRLLPLILVCVLGLAAAPQHSPDPFAGMTADVGRMGAASNPERRQALEAILTERGVPYAVETFPVEPRPNDPRPEGANLVVTLGQGAEVIVVGAHYDAVRLADGALSRGAIDNAASAVILTRLAETLLGENLHRQLQVVFFDMEEVGLVGSSRYAASRAGDAIVAAINLDVIAFGDTVVFGPTAGAGAGFLEAHLKQVLVDENVNFVPLPRFPGSDHRSFTAAGIPSLTISSMTAVEAHGLWLLLNGGAEGGLADGFLPRVLQRIHSDGDTAEMVEAAAMMRVHRIIERLVRRLDAAP